MRRTLVILVASLTTALAALVAIPGFPAQLAAETLDRQAAEDQPSHTLAFGGDVFVGRRLNYALESPGARVQIFGDLRDILRGADLALVNSEGVVSQGGQVVNKRESRPFYFRAQPGLIDVFVEAGIDVVTLGNNHSGDYGPEALREYLDRLRLAGMSYTGAGYNLEDARLPSYHRVGDTVIALVGADMTHTAVFRAQKEKPGSLYFEATHRGKRVGHALAILGQILTEARRHADVVLFSPHWGKNRVDRPTRRIRRFARKVIELGYDGILGHSSHVIHGVEIIDGKPVIYDAGNLVLDYGGNDWEHRGMLWLLTFTRAGVTEMRGIPVEIRKNQSRRAQGKVRTKALEELRKRSRDMGTVLTIRDGAVHLTLDPGGRRGPGSEAQAPLPAHPIPAALRKAPRDSVVDAVPADATAVEVTYDNGVSILGYKLLHDELEEPRGAQAMLLYLRADRKLSRSYRLTLRTERQRGDGTIQVRHDSHLPGDWAHPTTLWEPGDIIQDVLVYRVRQRAPGTVKFFVALRDGNKTLVPSRSNVPLKDGAYVPLGHSQFSSRARRAIEYLIEFRERQAAIP